MARAQGKTADAVALPQPGQLVGDKYEITSVLGEGGMGVVYRAVHRITGKELALKWMLPEAVQRQGAVDRFVREAQVAGRINHPHVVDIYDVGEHGGGLYLVMELLRGHDLATLLNRGELTLGEFIELMVQVGRGVQAAHRAGVVHRDLKPENIFVCESPDAMGSRSAKVLDFGISKVIAAAGQHATRLTQTGAALGTPYYMSPEQAQGNADVDHRTDVYSLAVVLFEACTGRLPFLADSYNALIVKIATEDAPSALRHNPTLPTSVDAVIRMGLCRDRDARYGSVEAMTAALSEALGGLTEAQRRISASGSRSSLLFGETRPSDTAEVRARARSGIAPAGTTLDRESRVSVVDGTPPRPATPTAGDTVPVALPVVSRRRGLLVLASFAALTVGATAWLWVRDQPPPTEPVAQPGNSEADPAPTVERPPLPVPQVVSGESGRASDAAREPGQAAAVEQPKPAPPPSQRPAPHPVELTGQRPAPTLEPQPEKAAKVRRRRPAARTKATSLEATGTSGTIRLEDL